MCLLGALHVIKLRSLKPTELAIDYRSPLLRAVHKRVTLKRLTDYIAIPCHDCAQRLVGCCSECLAEQVLWVDPYRGLKTLRHDLTLDRGVSFQAACKKLEFERTAGDRSSFMRSRHGFFPTLQRLIRVLMGG